MRALALVLAVCCAAACTAPAPRAEPPPANPLAVAQGLAPLAQFLGDWEGPAENMAGNFTVAKRLQWLVPDAWLLEQSVTFSPENGGEVARTALLYSYDPAAGAVTAELLLPGGARQRVFLLTADQGATWEVRPETTAPAQSLFRSTLLSAEEWQADSYERGPDGEWRQVERMTLRRKR